MTVPSDSAARRLLFVKVDTLGDLVLFSAALRAVQRELPEAHITAVIRHGYREIAPLLAERVQWVTTQLRPFAQGPEQQPEELRRLQDEVASLRPDTVIAATSRRNWLETAIAAASPASSRIALGDMADDEFFATQLRIRLNVDAATAYTEHVPVRPDMGDLERNFALASHLVGRPITVESPRLTLPKSVISSVATTLAAEKLSQGKYVAAGVAGFANVDLKTWPPERFAAVLDHTAAKYGLRALLIGHESEREHLNRVAAAMKSSPGIWVGRDGGLLELAGILGQAAIYVGNDTGAMHLAAALDVPVVAVFGGGTWPRFVPAARRAVSVVHPLPCFGCGWDCAFGDAPCIKEVTIEDVIAAIDAIAGAPNLEHREIKAVNHLPESTTTMMGKAAIRYHQARRDHLARQHKLEELTALDREKDDAIHEKEASIAEKEAEIHEKEAEIDQKEAEIDRKEAALFKTEASLKEKEASIFEKEQEIHTKQQEIDALRKVCDEREQLIITLDRNVRALQTQAATVAHDKVLLEKTLAELPVDHANSVRTVAGQASHIRNLEALVQIRNQELAEARATAENLRTGLQELEQAKFYGKLLSEKEAVIRDLSRNCEQREAVIRELTAKTTGLGAALWKLWYAMRMFSREKIAKPLGAWASKNYVERHWMQIGELRQYAPKPIAWDRLPPVANSGNLPQIAVVTPSYGQEKFIERTLRSVLDQTYPNLIYVVQDGGSKDRSAEIIANYAARLRHWESVPDKGQADAIRRGFGHVSAALAPTDVMAWLNSDDLLAPGALSFVADYFRRHPEVDVVYGHRIIIDDDDREVGRWIMPRHDPQTLEWIDYVPQETMFWRKRAWDIAGGIDPSFQFALDWDLLARFQQAGCRLVRLPYFLGAFRVHAEQKTTQVIHTVGADEMRRIRARFHGEKHDDAQTIDRHVRETRRRGVITARLLGLGIRR